MINEFIRLATKCRKMNKMSATVVDDFLICHVAGQERPGKEMDQRLPRFRKVTKEFDPGWINMIKAQS